jgi:hypothetical protein
MADPIRKKREQLAKGEHLAIKRENYERAHQIIYAADESR